ncbi:hypothetical protein [Rhizobium leguminosarum]|uniref:hypothetical protein n=1 Tax=Rhizobium leguminosarum TaxID=384 RepID=UPI0014421EF6
MSWIGELNHSNFAEVDRLRDHVLYELRLSNGIAATSTFESKYIISQSIRAKVA